MFCVESSYLILTFSYVLIPQKVGGKTSPISLVVSFPVIKILLLCEETALILKGAQHHLTCPLL